MDVKTKEFICFKCKYWYNFALGCRAFPEGIPGEIQERNEHDRPLGGQKNKFVFTPVNL